MNKNVLNKLFSEKEQSVELSEVQVELALVDDLKKGIQTLQNSMSKVGDERLKIIGAKNIMSKEIVNVNSIISDLEKQVSNYMNQIKELGIESIPPVISNINTEIGQSKKLVKKDFEEYIK